ncbi:hypothetical protein AN641_06565 [Candidatus Epulonipiscioides gigas]|nr:hypothetical protein AN641_06565 [Epulopiscium sp. SCG-C07WGA-EpuloA2]
MDNKIIYNRDWVSKTLFNHSDEIYDGKIAFCHLLRTAFKYAQLNYDLDETSLRIQPAALQDEKKYIDEINLPKGCRKFQEMYLDVRATIKRNDVDYNIEGVAKKRELLGIEIQNINLSKTVGINSLETRMCVNFNSLSNRAYHNARDYSDIDRTFVIWILTGSPLEGFEDQGVVCINPTIYQPQANKDNIKEGKYKLINNLGKVIVLQLKSEFWNTIEDPDIQFWLNLYLSNKIITTDVQLNKSMKNFKVLLDDSERKGIMNSFENFLNDAKLEVEIEAKEKGIKEGIKEGKAAGIKEGIEIGLNDGLSTGIDLGMEIGQMMGAINALKAQGYSLEDIIKYVKKPRDLVESMYNGTYTVQM